MSGQIVGYLQTVMANLDSPEKLIYGVVLILIIVYSSEIPSAYRIFADSILGRLFGIVIIYGVVHALGWVYGLLTAMAFLLVINGASRFTEGFSTTKKKIIGGKWVVEDILNENPSEIDIEHVETHAIKS
jgi:hypothetical protein